MGQPAARPLLWWTHAQLDALALALAGPWAAWLREWHGVSDGAAGVECVLSHEAQGVAAGWAGLAAAGDAIAWWDARAPGGEPVRTALFGAGTTVASTSLAAAMENKAWEALAVELAMALGLQRQPGDDGPPAADHAPWSGGVVASLSAPAATLRLFLNGACASKVLGAARTADAPAAKLPPVVEGISQLPARASVELAGCEIDLGDLQAVKVGDILRLPQALDEPMQVKIGSRPVCAAYLGRRGNSRAVELLHAPGR